MSKGLMRLAAIALFAAVAIGGPQATQADMVMVNLDRFNAKSTATGTGVAETTRMINGVADSDPMNGAITGGFVNYVAILSDDTDTFVWDIDQNGANELTRRWGLGNGSRQFQLAFRDERTNETSQLLTIFGGGDAMFSWTITDVNGEVITMDSMLSNLDRLEFDSVDFSTNASFDYDAVAQVSLTIDNNDQDLVTFNGGRLTLSTVPEPGTVGVLAMVSLGAIGFQTVRRRRKK